MDTKFVDEIEELQKCIIATILLNISEYDFSSVIKEINPKRFSKNNRIIINGIISFYKKYNRVPDFNDFDEYISQNVEDNKVSTYIKEVLIDCVTSNISSHDNIKTMLDMLDEYHIKRTMGRIN